MATATALSRKNSDTVRERKMRPLYDLLDSGNCKKVVQEAEKILKKQPAFSCVKVLKALAFIRLGKIPEGRTIITLVMAESPTDEPTLHALTICLRELESPYKVCELYENALKVEKSEELMTCLFFAYIRVLDYNKQYKASVMLYKSYPKGQYLHWVVMSLYVKALITDENKIAETVSLPLASKMMARYIDENQSSYTEGDVYLYIMVLFKMSDYGAALIVLEGARDKVKCYAQYSRLEMRCLVKLKDNEKLLAAFERNITHDPTDFKSYKQYVDVFGLTKADHLIEFLKGIAYDTELKVKTRTAVLALMLLAKVLLKNNVNQDSIELQSLFIDYFTKYGAKPFFLRDMKNVFNDVSDTSSVPIKLTGIMKPEVTYNYNGVSEDDATRLQWKANFECVQCLLKESEILADQTSVINTISSLVKTCQSMDAHCKNMRSDARDSCPYDDLFVSSCLLLMKTFWNKHNFWSGYHMTSGMQSLNVKRDNLEHSTENGLSPSPTDAYKQEWYECEFPIALNLALLEFGVANSPHWYPYRLLLGKTYFHCGAVEAGFDEIMRMDIKHMQLDSLGYLYIQKVLVSGYLSAARRALYHADSYYGSCNRELMEHIISAYKNSSWHQILEFMGFREASLKSVQAGQINVERRLLEFTMEGNNRESILKLARREYYDFKSAFTTGFVDNRDFSINCFMFETPAGQEYRDLTFNDSIERLKLRASVLGTITNFVLALSHQKDFPKFKECIENARCAYDAVSQCKKDVNQRVVKFGDRNLFGPWPPTAFEYPESCMFDCLYMALRIPLVAGTMNCSDHARGDFGEVNAMMDCVSNQVVEVMNFYMTHWGTVHSTLINMSNLNEELFLLVESLGFICILMDVLRGFLEKLIPSTSDTKGKKKKAKDGGLENVVSWVVPYNALIGTLRSCVMMVEKKLTELEKSCAGWYFKNWSHEQESYWKRVVPENIVQIVRKTLPIVCDKLRNSYRRTYAELKFTITSKKFYLETLEVVT